MANDAKKDQFLDILEENIGIILKISRIYAPIAQDREDLVNDITLELWKSFRKFRGKAKISTWIYRVALNTSMNYKRKKSKDRLCSSLNDSGVNPPVWLNEEDNSENAALLDRCIEELDELNKAIILLYLDGNSHEEISEITGISKTNVGTRIGRIKEQLKKLVIKKSDYYGV